MQKLSVPSTRWFLGPFDPLPTPWHSQPSSLAWDVLHISANFGCLHNWRYCNICPEVSLRTSSARLWRNWSEYCCLATWAGVMTLAVAIVCDRVIRAIILGSVVLSNLGGERSTVYSNLNLVCCATGAYCSMFDGTLGADRTVLGVWMTILGS